MLAISASRCTTWPRYEASLANVMKLLFQVLVQKRTEWLGPTIRKTKKILTYNRRDSQMVTHSSTSHPVQCLCMAERTGCPVLTDLWSYVLRICIFDIYSSNQYSSAEQSEKGKANLIVLANEARDMIVNNKPKKLTVLPTNLHAPNLFSDSLRMLARALTCN
jgi:hypothetical protein